ncbi:MAG: hypothetical protein RIC89_03715 [Pseudomonadales bacterium]
MNTKVITALLAGLTVAVGVYLVIDRNGIIAWLTLLAGGALLTKALIKPGPRDLLLTLGTAVVLVAAWVGTFYYVISTWETGEVVELDIQTNDGTHTARVWVLDLEADPTIYYDAPSQAANALLAGKPLQFTRAGETTTRIPEARVADELPEEEANRVFEAMLEKYGDRNQVTDIYYLTLGRSADQVGVVATLRAP